MLWLSSSLFRCNKLPDALNGFSGFRQSADLEDVDHARPDFESHVHAIGTSLLCDSDRIVAQHFVFAKLNQPRRQSAEITKQR